MSERFSTKWVSFKASLVQLIELSQRDIQGFKLEHQKTIYLNVSTSFGGIHVKLYWPKFCGVTVNFFGTGRTKRKKNASFEN